MKRIFSFIIFFAITATAMAQNLNIHQDSRINALISKQRAIYAADSTLKGYRIHVFMEIGNEALKHAEETKRRFENAFPDIPIYLSYSEPYFRLRAGNFRNRVEAEKCLRRIKPRFKEAFVTADAIYRPKIKLGNNEE